jgi:hypothetical protein
MTDPVGALEGEAHADGLSLLLLLLLSYVDGPVDVPVHVPIYVHRHLHVPVHRDLQRWKALAIAHHNKGTCRLHACLSM